MVVLEEQGGCLGVVLAGSNVESWEADLALGVVLQEQGDHLFVTLLESHRQGGKAVLERDGGIDTYWDWL